MKAIDFTSECVFVKYVDPQKPTAEEIVINVKAACFNLLPFLNNKIAVTSIVGIVQHERGNIKSGSWVAAMLPVDRDSTLSEFLPVSISDVVLLPEEVDSFDVILSLEAVVRSYTALAMHSSVSSGHAVLILDGASAENFVMLQLAVHAGCKVLTTVQDIDDEQFLQVIDKIRIGNVGVSGWKSLERFVAEETNDLGVDLVVDTRVRYTSDLNCENETWRPEKFELINCLAPYGKWITSESKLQLDPPESSAMFHKCASLSFLNQYAWLLSNYKQGVFLQILDEAVNKIAKGIIKPPKYEIVTLKELESVGTMLDLFDSSKCHVLKMA